MSTRAPAVRLPQPGGSYDAPYYGADYANAYKQAAQAWDTTRAWDRMYAVYPHTVQKIRSRRSFQDVKVVIGRCARNIDSNTERYPGMSYEAGIIDALWWLVVDDGDNDDTWPFGGYLPVEGE